MKIVNTIGEWVMFIVIGSILIPFAYFEWLTEENPNHRGFYDQHTTRTGYFPGS